MRWAVLVLAGCHVVTHDQVIRPMSTQKVVHPEGAIARTPTLVLTDAGRFRFVEPLECPTEEIVTQITGTEVVTRPNYATLVVGIVATAVGGVLTVQGLSEDGSPLLYAGIGLAGAGLPFAIGPWIGNGVDLRERGTSPLRRPGPSEPCGERGFGRAATLQVRGMEIRGTIDRDGLFSVSPYHLVDAFTPTASGAWEVHATIEADGGARTAQVTLDNNALVTRAKTFLASADFDTTIEPMRLVPGLVPGTLRASLTSTAEGPAIRIVLPIENQGPGPAWAVRGQIVAPTAPAIDGRILYAGAIAKGAVGTMTALVPVTDAAASALRNATLEFSVELRDAHGTAPATPVKFRGIVLVDAPR